MCTRYPCTTLERIRHYLRRSRPALSGKSHQHLSSCSLVFGSGRVRAGRARLGARPLGGQAAITCSHCTICAPETQSSIVGFGAWGYSPKQSNRLWTFRSGRRLSRALREGCRESRRCSRDTYPESYITMYTSIRRKKGVAQRAYKRVVSRHRAIDLYPTPSSSSSSSLLLSSPELIDTQVYEP